MALWCFPLDPYIPGKMELSPLKSCHRGYSCRTRMQRWRLLLTFMFFSNNGLLMTNSIYGVLLAAMSFFSNPSPVFSASWNCGAHCVVSAARRLSLPSVAVLLLGAAEIPLSVLRPLERHIGARHTDEGASRKSGDKSRPRIWPQETSHHVLVNSSMSSSTLLGEIQPISSVFVVHCAFLRPTWLCCHPWQSTLRETFRRRNTTPACPNDRNWLS